MLIKFRTAEGLGNKFVFIEETNVPGLSTTPQLLAYIDQHSPFDQLILIQSFIDNELNIKIINRDGSLAEACGNAFRALGAWAKERFKVSEFTITNHLNNKFNVALLEHGSIQVTFPTPKFSKEHIPITDIANSSDIHLPEFNLFSGFAVNVGNPHIVFKVDRLDLTFLKTYGEQITNLKLFPEKINLSLMQITAPDHISIITYERGAGITQACGSAALACSISARFYLQLCDESSFTVSMLGGKLITYWKGHDHPIVMKGTASLGAEIILHIPSL
ncbi:diaminopimelate epimerase [Rickettsiales endosymbiont of Stachyamoeba lipophora]|uniref:diaminopimelate epimerase n=1 Tax=Rickettsiales endosymbiont of Stachyamoeba lipophora TaxID=2486578 RepID=UPI000F6454CB|nr:diaminopimelate epimerase [Rickettsiales endosymbiont of Stachyamoeba lipophora]AZL15509.1 diaminopimelate epimerase [Rickettsiales endosymbiont of Stachyamoeba lipophora]